VLGFGLVGLQVVSIPTIAISYAIDCYTPVAGQIMVISTVCKNTFGVSQVFPYPVRPSPSLLPDLLLQSCLI
jgi:hypothetical protein